MPQINQSDVRARGSLGLAASYGLAIASPYLLDSLLPDGVTSARSLHRLSVASPPICLRVRRVTDNALADVMYDEIGKVSLTSLVQPVAGGAVATLGVWSGAARVVVVDHGDQSGRSAPYSPIVIPNASQPLLLNAGAFVTNEGSPALIAYDGVDDYSEWRFTRGHPHTVILAGSMPGAATSGAPFAIDGQVSGAPANSGAAIIPGNPGRQMFSDLAVGDATDDRNHYRTYVAVFNSSQSVLYVGGAQVAAGDSGAEPVVNLLVGKNASGVYSNTSYHTLITVSRALSAAEAGAVSAMIAGW